MIASPNKVTILASVVLASGIAGAVSCLVWLTQIMPEVMAGPRLTSHDGEVWVIAYCVGASVAMAVNGLFLIAECHRPHKG